MPYGNIVLQRFGQRLVIDINLPERGETSASGRSENLVDPKTWTRIVDGVGELDVKLTVCRPYRRGRRSEK